MIEKVGKTIPENITEAEERVYKKRTKFLEEFMNYYCLLNCGRQGLEVEQLEANSKDGWGGVMTTWTSVMIVQSKWFQQLLVVTVINKTYYVKANKCDFSVLVIFVKVKSINHYDKPWSRCS